MRQIARLKFQGGYAMNISVPREVTEEKIFMIRCDEVMLDTAWRGFLPTLSFPAPYAGIGRTIQNWRMAAITAT